MTRMCRQQQFCLNKFHQSCATKDPLLHVCFKRCGNISNESNEKTQLLPADVFDGTFFNQITGLELQVYKMQIHRRLRMFANNSDRHDSERILEITNTKGDIYI